MSGCPRDRPGHSKGSSLHVAAVTCPYVANKEKELLSSLLSWSNTQGQILTGGGLLPAITAPERDYKESDLPHYHLSNRSTKRAIHQWLAEDRRSFGIIGVWSRPLFAGGWLESTSADTEAFNFQTPSLFIDMRFPTLRPTMHLKQRKSLHDCTPMELRLLARQHCFSGYSLLEKEHEYTDITMPLYTRHHVIDWNYYPQYPRNRPNRWWIELKPDNNSFKEFSFARDSNHIPVYFERWQRFPEDGNGQKYLAARKITNCPFAAIAAKQPYSRDGIFIVIGNMFAMATDRPTVELPPLVDFDSSKGVNCAVVVDHFIQQRDKLSAEKVLSLIGSMGYIHDGKSNSWHIGRSTHPWLEGSPLLDIAAGARLQFDHKDNLVKIKMNDEEWEVMECSFTKDELHRLFDFKLSAKL